VTNDDEESGRRKRDGASEDQLRGVRLVPVPILGDTAYSYANNVRNGRIPNESPHPGQPRDIGTPGSRPAPPSIHLPLFTASSLFLLSLFLSPSLSIPGNFHAKKNMKLIRIESISCTIIFSRRHFHRGAERETERRRAIRELFPEGGTLRISYEPVLSERLDSSLDVFIFKVAFWKSAEILRRTLTTSARRYRFARLRES